MKFAIRDDDTSFFTKPQELESAYDFIEKGCVSLSVVPSTVFTHKNTVFPYGEGEREGYFDIEDNSELIEYLKQKKKEGRYDVLLHGYSHEYKEIGGKWYSEMQWKDTGRLKEELRDGKTRLERALDCEISVFVAPNNHMGKKGIAAIEELGMNFSGIIQLFDRKITPRYIINSAKRWSYRLTKKIQYPRVMNYGKHKELAAYGMDGKERLIYEYEQCKKKNAPFVIYTHYWHVNNTPKLKELLKEIYQYAISDGAELVALSDCFG